MYVYKTSGSKIQYRALEIDVRKFEKGHMTQEDRFKSANVPREESHELIFLQDHVPQAEIAEISLDQRSKHLSKLRVSTTSNLTYQCFRPLATLSTRAKLPLSQPLVQSH